MKFNIFPIIAFEIVIHLVVSGQTKMADLDQSPRIVNGYEAMPHQFPWQVVLERLDNGTFKFKCGGVIIDKTHVLTAAHCIVFSNVHLTPKEMRVIVGAHNYTNYSAEPYQKTHKVCGVRVHPHYNASIKRYDIALITLPKPLEFNLAVMPIRLARPEDNPAGQTCIVSGWGVSELPKIRPPILQALNLTVLSKEECMRRHKEHPNWQYIDVDFDTIECTWPFTGNDSQSPCYGDSGGPLTCYDSNGPYLPGVVSWGPAGCGTSVKGFMYAFSKITSSLDWIKCKN